jgi:DeoR/GlpR family transcriptional regulator of sugar metabolism
MRRRREEILELLIEHGRLAVEELAERFGVTGMTIRRDLSALEAEGLLTRTLGGCVLRGSTAVRERPFDEKRQQNRRAKEAIARAAAGRVEDGSSLYLDTGTTCCAVASVLAVCRKNLRVFTNNLPAAMELFAAECVEVVVLGGLLGRRSPDLTGEVAVRQLQRYRLDIAVVGADAVDPAAGQFYSADMATAELLRTAQAQAERVFLCIDASKFDRRSLAVAGELDSKVTLFTDRAIEGRNAPRGSRRAAVRTVLAETAR